ncbi:MULTISPECIES: serine hydrolase [Subtercola]|uniref:Serine hydrolase n=1 Tax=Subtercola vilae TaxID=2056433 RepID=A0A4T2BQL6_9MICO|nr:MULTISPECIES: serine hydrolase [Subtercola]MEA9986113.1 serine hydrolase [Subtercola sp. RTI3]TIH33747.1 serine hydrolase [Subtercola vilae]
MRRDRRRAGSELPSGRRSSAAAHDTDTFRRGFVSLTNLALSGVQITASALDVESEKVLFSIDDHLSVPTASLGKVLLLIEVAARLTQRETSAHGLLDRTVVDSAADTGLWQHLQVPMLPVADLAVLIASSSDNLATNVLLRHIGLDKVRERGESLGLSRTFLLDKVRDHRGPDDAPHLSVGSARELSTLFRNLAEGTVVDVATSQQVLSWLGLGADLSMVASAFGLDPLSHTHSDHGLLLVNKTGTGKGIRTEAGVLRGPRAGVAYAVTMRFNDADLNGRLAVLDGMRTLGTDILEYVH